ncbi:MAG: PDZ domain-containing protein [Chloroflexi bacterium]|nr:MAG: PDZ domain-containing protein [Chloroflexota bacterium]
MNKKKLLVASLIVVLVLTACRFSFNLPGMSSSTNVSPTPVEQVESAVVATPPVPTQAVLTPLTPLDLGERDALLTTLYNAVSPGVVSILVTTADGGGVGSGFVYQTGYVVTNYHVVEGETALEIDFPSGYKARGTVVGSDLDSDLAVIKVDAPDEVFVPLTMGDSDSIAVGQTVVAIGNPFRLSGTMTVGIVSAKGRTLDSLRQSESGNFFTAGDIIQTDASINPGNSGGPLLNLNGEVVGINRAIRTTGTTATGDPVNSGIGFAISGNIVKRVVPVLIEKGSYDYPYLGITSREDLTLDMIETLGLARQTGAYVTSVAPGSPADKAGIIGGVTATSFAGLPSGGDLIIAVDGRPIHTFSEMLSYLIANKSPGDKIDLTVLRGTEEKEVTITLGKRP